MSWSYWEINSAFSGINFSSGMEDVVMVAGGYAQVT